MQKKNKSLEDILHGIEQTREVITRDKEKTELVKSNIEVLIDICEETPAMLDEATHEFNKLTSIFNKKDIPFFVFSVLLQGAMKYFIKYLRELKDDELAKKTPGHKEEHSNRSGKLYYATKEEIVTNPVPFDAFRLEYTRDWYKEFEIPLPGFSGFNHRVKAIGHDPLLGLIFGTANIMTSTITRNDFRSWHVDTRKFKGKAINGTEYTADVDKICSRASTPEIFVQIKERLESEGNDGWIALGCALLKEIVHLFSDLPSKQSLPFPIISTFDYQLAEKLSLYGLNTGTIAQGAFATKLINWAIGFLHGLARGKDEDKELYRVRTQKIIEYSNILATMSDIGFSLFLAYTGDKNTMRKFDLGGYLVTLHQISHSTKVHCEIEQEFYVKKIINKFKEIEQNESCH